MEDDEDRLLATLLHNLISYMLLMKVVTALLRSRAPDAGKVALAACLLSPVQAASQGSA